MKFKITFNKAEFKRSIFFKFSISFLFCFGCWNNLFGQNITPIPLPHDPSLNYYQKRDQIIQHFRDLDSANIPYEADEFLKYARWIDFWQDRVDNSPGVIGDTKHYTESIPLILNDASQNCNSGLNPVWEQLPIQTTLSQQGRIDALAFDGNSNTLFAGNNRSGIWKISTTTQGAQWENVSDNINKPIVGCMDLELYYGNPQNPLSTPVLYAGTGSVNNWDNNISYGVFRSNDLGNTWTNVLPFANDVNESVIKIISYYEPNAQYSPNHDVIFVATERRVFRSLDGGINWTLVYSQSSLNNPSTGRAIGSMTLDFDNPQMTWQGYISQLEPALVSHAPFTELIMPQMILMFREPPLLYPFKRALSLWPIY